MSRARSRRARFSIVRWLLVCVCLCAACARSPGGTRCEVVCRAEARCAERLELTDVSYAACVDACTDLERGEATAKLVDEHVRCVNEAPDCAAAMECP